MDSLQLKTGMASWQIWESCHPCLRWKVLTPLYENAKKVDEAKIAAAKEVAEEAAAEAAAAS